MSPMRRRSLLCLACLLLPASWLEAAGFMEWICMRLKKDCSAIIRAGAVRGDSPRVGMRLALYDPQAKTEVTLWEGQVCWSPAVLSSSEVAALGTAGIWRVPVPAGDRKPTLAVKATGLLQILGLAKEGEGRLLVLLDAGPQCCPRLGLADLDHGTVVPAEGQSSTCQPLDEHCDVFGLRVDQIRGDLLVEAVDLGPGRPSVIRIRDLAKPGPKRLLLGDDRRWDDGLSRLDPIWWGQGGQAVYVTGH